MSFQITGLDAAPFRRFYGLSDEELQGVGVKRLIADTRPGFPDRVELRDVERGEALLLLNYLHQPPELNAQLPQCGLELALGLTPGLELAPSVSEGGAQARDLRRPLLEFAMKSGDRLPEQQVGQGARTRRLGWRHETRTRTLTHRMSWRLVTFRFD